METIKIGKLSSASSLSIISVQGKFSRPDFSVIVQFFPIWASKNKHQIRRHNADLATMKSHKKNKKCRSCGKISRLRVNRNSIQKEERRSIGQIWKAVVGDGRNLVDSVRLIKSYEMRKEQYIGFLFLSVFSNTGLEPDLPPQKPALYPLHHDRYLKFCTMVRQKIRSQVIQQVRITPIGQIIDER